MQGLAPFSIPVLSFKFDNQEELSQKLQDPNRYGGMVVTSQRAVEAMVLCVANFVSHEVWIHKLAKLWKEKPIFAVGKATAQAVRDNLGLQCTGDGTGSAEALVPFILQSYTPDSKPLLFPCGNLRREAIPTAMAKAGIGLDSIHVYCTCADPNVKHLLDELMKKQGVPSYAVFFSPSGVNFTQDILSGSEEWDKVKLVAIGKTTADTMKNKGWKVCAVSEQPNAHCLAKCVVQCCDGDQ